MGKTVTLLPSASGLSFARHIQHFFKD